MYVIFTLQCLARAIKCTTESKLYERRGKCDYNSLTHLQKKISWFKREHSAVCSNIQNIPDSHSSWSLQSQPVKVIQLYKRPLHVMCRERGRFSTHCKNLGRGSVNTIDFGVVRPVCGGTLISWSFESIGPQN